MVVPEKTAQVRKLVVPAWVLRGAVIGLVFTICLIFVAVADYWYVMSQIGENKSLRLENRRLRQQVQVFQNKMDTIQSTLDRIKTFATRLKVITNIEDSGGLLQSLNQKLPDASSNVGTQVAQGSPKSPSAHATIGPAPEPRAAPASAASATSAASADPRAPQAPDPDDPEELALQRDFQLLEGRFTSLNKDSLFVEMMLQDQYELLADQKAFLAALPTRKPAVGYFTSGFGIRRAPYGGRVKMHEGLDIANRPGTPIRAPADGTVAFANSRAGYGQIVILDHGYGLETWYGHTRKMLVNKGQKVRRGDTIALLGNSGRSTGPHLHYEVRVHGTPVDPLSYILEN
jgi:murein DD-endopeptidase MepM/ murein hydrolase activator NlpD